MVGGGRMNNITSNNFRNNKNNILFDNRGETWQTSYCEVGGTFNQQLDGVNYKNPPWSEAYPWLPSMWVHL